jgi:hypothetical protein
VLLTPAALNANAPNTLPLPSNPRALAATDMRNFGNSASEWSSFELFFR